MRKYAFLDGMGMLLMAGQGLGESCVPEQTFALMISDMVLAKIGLRSPCRCLSVSATRLCGKSAGWNPRAR